MIKKSISLCIALSFIGCATVKKIEQSAKRIVEAPDRKVQSFRVSWVKNLDPVYNTGNLPIGTSAPFIFEDILYMGDLSGVIRAYDLESGKTLWSFNDKQAIQSQVNKVGDYVYYGTRDGRFFARHYLTGKLHYSVDLNAAIESQAVYASGRLILHLRDHTIITLDAETGKVFWRYRRSIPYTTTLQRVSRVLPYKNNVIVGFADGYLVSLSLAEGVISWEQKISTGLKFVDVDVKPIYFNGKIVAGSAAGPIRFLSPRTGAITKTVEVFQSSHPLILGDEFITGSVFGDIVKIGKSGKVKLKKNLGDNGISSIAPWKGGYIVTTMGEMVYHINKSDFSVINTFSLGSAQSASFGDIAIGEDAVSVYSSRNRLYVFR